MSSFIYELMRKDILLASVNTNTGGVSVFNRLPIGLELVDSPKDVSQMLQNVLRFKEWCAERTLMMSQKYAKLVCNALAISQDVGVENKASIALSYHCSTLNDHYWVRKEGEAISYKDVSLFRNTSRNILTPIALKGENKSLFVKSLKNWSDIGVDGTLAKSWVREDGDYYLYKACDNAEEEVLASKVLSMLNVPHVQYEKTEEDGLKLSRCKCFTNEVLGFIPFRTFLKQGNLTEVKRSFLVEYANLAVCTYLLGNEDLHDKNWGFSIDDTGELTGLAPLFDFDGCFMDSYAGSKRLLFLPECVFVSESGREVVVDEFDIENCYEPKGMTIEEAALEYAEFSSIDLENIDVEIVPEKFRVEFADRVNILIKQREKSDKDVDMDWE